METEFIQKWHEVRTRQQSNIVAGLDPAPAEMGRSNIGLPEGTELLSWATDFIDAVAPYVAAVKMNQAYYQDIGQREILRKLVERVHERGLLAVSDNKIADIGNTNDAWIYYNAKLGFDTMTCAPYAGNIEGTVEMAHARRIGMITMGLMSNPEYRSEMNYVDPKTSEPLWKSRTRRSMEAGADGIAVGGTYTKEDSEFMEFVTLTNNSPVLYLIPGIGAQGGAIEAFLASYIAPEKCMLSSSRGVMFPNGAHSTPKEQAEAAKALRDAFNTVAKLYE